MVGGIFPEGNERFRFLRYTAPGVDMPRFWESLVDVRKGEGIQLVISFSVLFLMVSAHVMLETTRDALFLGTFSPKHLAIVYAGLAGLVLLVMAFNTALVRRTGRRNALIGTLMVFSYGTVVFYLIPMSRSVVFALYLWSGLLGTLVVVQFWMLVGQLFTVGQGKRLFGPLAAGGSAGAFVGAFLAACLLQFASVKSLLLVTAGIFLVAAWILTSVNNEDMALPSPGAIDKGAHRRSQWVLFWQQPYLGRVIAIVLLSTVTFLTVDYLFKSVVTRSMVVQAGMPAANQLGNFFASFYAVTGAVALVVQLVGAGYIIKRFGVLAAILVMPLALLLGGLGTAILGAVVALVVVTKGADSTLRHSLHRVTMELLWLPVGTEVRSRTKGTVDGVLVRATQAGVAALLFLIAELSLDTPRVLSAVVAGSAFLWLIFVIALRDPYLEQFRAAISRQSLETGGDLDLNAAQVLVEALSSPDTPRVIAAMDLLATKKRDGLIPSLILYHESPKVLVRALGIIGASERRDWVPLAQRLLQHEHAEVRVAALHALARNDLVDQLNERLLDVSPAVRAHAAFRLAIRSQLGDKLEFAEIHNILSMAGEQAKVAQLALLDAIRDSGDETWAEVILRLAKSSDADIMESAIMAMGKVQDARFIPLLIEQLGVRRGRGVVRSALVGLGEGALVSLQDAIQNANTERRVRIHLPRTITHFGTVRAANFLLEHLRAEQDGMVRFKILSSLARMVVDHTLKLDQQQILGGLQRNLEQYLRILSLRTPLSGAEETAENRRTEGGELLCGLLDDKLRQALERCFLLLQIAHRHEDIRSAYEAIQSTDRHRRANAVEFIDALTRSPFYEGTLGAEVREYLQLVVDDLPAQDKVNRSRKLIGEPPTTYEQAISRLLGNPDEITASIAAYHVFELGLSSLRSQVAEVLQRKPLLTALGQDLQDLLAVSGG